MTSILEELPQGVAQVRPERNRRKRARLLLGLLFLTASFLAFAIFMFNLVTTGLSGAAGGCGGG